MMESAEQMPRLTQTAQLPVSGKRHGDGRGHSTRERWKQNGDDGEKTVGRTHGGSWVGDSER